MQTSKRYAKLRRELKNFELKKSSWQDTQAKSLDCLAHNNDRSCSTI